MCQMLVCQYVVYGQGEVMEHDTYVTHTKVYKGVTKLWEDCVCPKGQFEEWHKLDCLMGGLQNVGWASCQYVLMIILQMVFHQWLGDVLSKILLG
jgi:hypothetical protein